MDNAEIPPNIRIDHGRLLQCPVLVFGEIGHGALQLCDDLAWHKWAGSEDT